MSLPKRLLSIGLAGVLLLALGGCFREKTPDVLTLTWWITFPPDSDAYPAFQAIADAYTEKTGRVVDLVSVPWEDLAPRGSFDTRLSAAQEGGTGPDLWGPVPHNWTGSLVAKGQALALEAGQVQDVGQYMQAALQACQVEGQQYALPVLIDSVALIYNKALVPTLPASFEGLVSLAQELTDAQNDRWGLVLPLLSPYHVYPFIDGYGGYVFRCEGSACNLSDVGLNSEGAVRGVEYLSSLYRTKKLFPESLADRDLMEQEALRLFSEGKAAMLIDGSWALPEIRAHGIDYGVAPIPTLPGAEGPPRPFTVVQAVFASANTDHPGEAVDLLNYVAGPESALALYKALGKTPVRRDVLRSPDLRGDRTIQGWQEQVTIGVPLPDIAELDYVWTPWGRALDEAIPGLTPAQEALDRAVEEIKGTLEQALVP